MINYLIDYKKNNELYNYKEQKYKMDLKVLFHNPEDLSELELHHLR